MAFSRVQQIVENCYNGGNQWETSFTKQAAVTSVQSFWHDLSSAPGNPRPNYYVGSELTATAFSGYKGIFHGGDVAPRTKHLHRFLISCNVVGIPPIIFCLMDYLLFYPLVDMDSTDEQLFDNTITLPRYTDGTGVQAFLVATNPYIGGAYFTISYTNHLGESGRNSFREQSNTTTNMGTIVNSGYLGAGAGGKFIRLAPGDKGIRSVESITFSAPNGGLAALVLAMPLAVVALNEGTASAEYDFMSMKPTLPRIYDGAYLNLIGAPYGTWSAVRIMGLASFVWN